MTRQQAIERVDKLRRITVERGATEHEAQAARARAAAVIARYGLDRAPARPAGARAGPAGAYARSSRTDRRSPGSRRFVAFA